MSQRPRPPPPRCTHIAPSVPEGSARLADGAAAHPKSPFLCTQGTDLTSLEGIGTLFGPGGASSSRGAASLSSMDCAEFARPTSSAFDHTGRHPYLDAEQLISERLSANSSTTHLNSNGSGSDGANDGDDTAVAARQPARQSHHHHLDHSSSDSADAASAASTLPHAVATRRSSKEHNAGKQQPALAPREGSPPENDSASGDTNLSGDANSNNSHFHGSSEAHSNGSESDENGSSPPLDPCGNAAGTSLPSQAPHADAASAAASAGTGGLAAATVAPTHAPPGQGVPPSASHSLLDPSLSCGGGGASRVAVGVGAKTLGAQRANSLNVSSNGTAAAALQGASPGSLSAGAAVAGGVLPGVGVLPGSGGVLQGVLPFPGQGVVELQQGVLATGTSGDGREDFVYPGAAVANGGVMGVADATLMLLAQHASPHVDAMQLETQHPAPTTEREPERTGVARGVNEKLDAPMLEDSGHGGEPPAKRAAASMADALTVGKDESMSHADGVDERPAGEARAVSRQRAEFGGNEPSAMDTSTGP